MVHRPISAIWDKSWSVISEHCYNRLAGEMKSKMALAAVFVAATTAVVFLPLTAGADPSPGDSGGLQTGGLTQVKNPQDITVPNPLTPSDVTSPLDKFRYGLQQDYPDSFAGISVNPNDQYVVEEVGSNATFEADAQRRFSQIPTQMHVTVPVGRLNSLSHQSTIL